MSRPNIVFYFSDQQRWDTLGCYGQPLRVTPNLDALAANGTRYENAFTCQPVCGPARACLQTGRYATEVGCEINGRALPFGSVKTLAQSFNEAGYATAYVGKWHLATDHAAGINYETSAIPQERRGGYRDYWMAADVLEFTSHGYNGYVYNADNERVPFMGYRADCINNFAIDFLHGRKEQTEPFFLFISQIEPHHQNDRRRYEGPDGSRAQFADFQPPGIWRPAQEPVHRARTSAIGGKIIPIIWGAVTAWITTLDVWLIRSKSRNVGKHYPCLHGGSRQPFSDAGA